MKDIKPFIDLGWHTIPLKGKLERINDAGDKTVPVFEKDWKAKYTEEKNTVVSKLGGVITGRCSGICAIDCDNSVTYELFHNLDPDYEFIFKSKGKGSKECGTIIYKISDNHLDSFSINNDVLALDFYADNGMVYLPTEANKTKYPMTAIPELKEMPDTVGILLSSLTNPKSDVTATENTNNVMTAQCLQPLVKQFVDDRKFMPGLFKIITPRAFRKEPQYVKEGYLHPNNVPEGRGSEYLSKISAILGADISIDQELYALAMHDINDLWDSPMDSERLDKTIIDPMIEGKATIDGKVIWQYDEDWSEYRLVFKTKRQASLEIGYDDIRMLYYVIDLASEQIKKFDSDNPLYAHLKAIAVGIPSKSDILTAMPLINVTSHPSQPFGFVDGNDPTTRTLNTFIRTPELAIINNPESYKEFYKEPKTILKFLEHLMPEPDSREYTLKFLKRKLTYFEYSPVILYFLGVHGSGKDAFVRILEQIMGHVSRPSTKEFLEIYNNWILDTYFVQLDEYGNQLSTRRDKDEALGKLKAFTGKQEVSIRLMRTDGFIYKHHATFVMTQNKNPLMLEDGDRRLHMLNTPTKLQDAEWVDDAAKVYNQLFREIKDFCYYLATEVEMPTLNEYTQPPETGSKHRLIADSMYVAARIAYALKHGMFDYIKQMADEYGSHKMQRALEDQRIYHEDMEELYDYMTEMKGDFRALNKEIKAAGVPSRGTSKNGGKAYYYDVNFGEEDE